VTSPTLVIAGAPRCGTSTLFAWLGAHPDVRPSAPKETFFLMDRDNPLRNQRCNVHDHGLEAYARFFPDKPGARVTLEATTHYLYQRTALAVLRALPEPPHVVVLLRRPGARVYSSFRYTAGKLARVRAELDFARYLELARRAPQELSDYVDTEQSRYVLARDLEYSRYAEHLEPWRAAYPRERLHVLLFETMVKEPQRTVAAVSRWLGIDPTFYRTYDFPRRNEGRAVNAPRLHRFLRNLRSFLPWRGPARLRRWYAALQDGGASVPNAADQQVLDALEETYRGDNQRLAERFDLDVAPWTTA
jgi:hypothetical protein